MATTKTERAMVEVDERELAELRALQSKNAARRAKSRVRRDARSIVLRRAENRAFIRKYMVDHGYTVRDADGDDDDDA